MFDFNVLRKKLEEITGYSLFGDYGELAEAHMTQRRDMNDRQGMNDIYTPIVGIVRMNPTVLTATNTPYMAVQATVVEIPCPPDYLDDVKEHLNSTAQRYNGTVFMAECDGIPYTVVFSFETCAVSTRKMDAGFYDGDIFPITQTVTFTIIEKGVTALDEILRIDGHVVPFLYMQETKAVTSETVPNGSAQGESAFTMEMLGITFECPLMNDGLGELLRHIVREKDVNVLHVVEVETNGESYVRLMGVGSATLNSQPPVNVGCSLSLVPICMTAAKRNGIWSNGRNVSERYVTEYVIPNGYVDWGDGTIEHNSNAIIKNMGHYYETDGSHTIYKTRANTRYAPITGGVYTQGKNLRYTGKRLDVSLYNGDLYTSMDGGGSIGIEDGRLCMIRDAVAIPVDVYDPSDGKYYLEPGTRFKSIIGGRIQVVNNIGIEYDLYAINEEEE